MTARRPMNFPPDNRGPAPQSSNRVEQAWSEMRELAARGVLPRAIDFVDDSLPDVDKIDILYGEYVLRREAGHEVDVEKWLQQVPSLAAALQRQLEFDQAVLKEKESGFTTIACEQGAGTHQPAVNSGRALPQLSTDNCEFSSIGPYQILSKLSRGGQADVYRAAHPHLHRLVVVKVAHHNDSDALAAQQLLHEGRLMVEIDHPNVAKVYDAGILDGRPYVVTEYTSGMTLRDYVTGRSIAPAEAVQLVARLARGVGAAHELGIVHLDVKPENVIMTPEAQPLLIDFGLGAKRSGIDKCQLEPGVIRGTLSFMPPEQAKGDVSKIGPPSDVFALGALLYFLCVGQPPYDFSSKETLLQNLQEGNWNRSALQASSTPFPIQRVIQRALDASPKERYANGHEMAEALEHISLRSELWRRTFLGTAAAAALGLGWYVATRQGQHVPPLPPQGTPPRLHLQVFAENRFVELVDRVPLHDGDLVRITATVPADHHATLILRSGNGKLTEIAKVAARRTPQQLRYPSQAAHAAPLEGPPGTEVLWLCVSRDTYVSHEAFARHAGKQLRALPPLPDDMVLRVDNERVTIVQQPRDFGSPAPVETPMETVKRILDSIRKRLLQELDFVTAIAYLHAAP